VKTQKSAISRGHLFMSQPASMELRLAFQCSSELSLEVVRIMDDMKVRYKVVDQAALAPAYPEILYTIMITIGSGLVIETLKALFKRLGQMNVFVDYETRYQAALKYLEDKGPLICESRDDRKEFSEYGFTTRESRYRWTFDRGEVTLRAEK